jgi:hypothetical protein
MGAATQAEAIGRKRQTQSKWVPRSGPRAASLKVRLRIFALTPYWRQQNTRGIAELRAIYRAGDKCGSKTIIDVDD